MAASKFKYVGKAQAVQLQRIQEDEKVSNQEETIKNEIKASLNASWTESLEESSQRKMLKRKNEEIIKEVKLGKKAVIMIRKAQLKELLSKEREQYERELNEIGLAFHKERL